MQSMTAKAAICSLHRIFSLTLSASVLAGLAASAQNSIQVFSPVNVRLSASSTGPGSDEVVFSTSTLNLTCPASGISAKVASTADGMGKVLVDNYVTLSVSQGQATNGPVNICQGGVPDGTRQNCFTAAYRDPASHGQLTGLDPDNFSSTGGVAPINVSSSFFPGANTVTLGLVDRGGYLASSSIYLNTNCTSNGVTGPSQISGNPIPSTNPPPALLTQNFSFNSAASQQVEQIYDLSYAQSGNTLTITDGTIPTVSDTPIDPAAWQSDYVKGTSFATSSCLIHDGEKLPNGKPACKLYTVTCQVGQGSTASGAQCPVSTARNEVFEDVFDGPSFSFPDIVANGRTFHQGVGYLMASEGWKGGACVFDSASGLQNDLCPKNLLTVFSGPGLYGGKGTTNHPNSAFITVAPVPEDRTKIAYIGYPNQLWVNSHTLKATVESSPPEVPAPNNDFIAAPIVSITYGISPRDEVPSTEFPIASDTVLTNPVGCPSPGDSSAPPAARFQAPDQTITVAEDGKYLLHYFATDCAGTEELYIAKNPKGVWNTVFYVKELNVDTVAPQVTFGPELSPAPTYIHGTLGYAVGQKVTAKYSCSDDFSGVGQCGTKAYSDPVTNPPAVTSVVDTSTPGTKTYKVGVTDAALNHGASTDVAYTVVAQ
jgi:hypothetical protein